MSFQHSSVQRLLNLQLQAATISKNQMKKVVRRYHSVSAGPIVPGKFSPPSLLDVKMVPPSPADTFSPFWQLSKVPSMGRRSDFKNLIAEFCLSSCCNLYFCHGSPNELVFVFVVSVSVYFSCDGPKLLECDVVASR